MKDERGVYYHPNPANKDVRMYVRADENETILFRMWSRADPRVWEGHEWIPLDVVRRAAAMYTGSGADPTEFYDIHVARALLKAEAEARD
jgi:hypothetical protein